MRESTFNSPPSGVAEKLGVSRDTMTGLLDGLAQDGLVERVFSESDRRSVRISLTPLGPIKLDAVMPGHYPRLKPCMQGLSEAQRQQFQIMLGLIYAGIPACKAPTKPQI